MANVAHLSILTAIALSTSLACGGSQKEAEAPAEEPADEGAVDDEMMGLAEGDMPDDGFDDSDMDEGVEDEETSGDEMPE